MEDTPFTGIAAVVTFLLVAVLGTAAAAFAAFVLLWFDGSGALAWAVFSRPGHVLLPAAACGVVLGATAALWPERLRLVFAGLVAAGLALVAGSALWVSYQRTNFDAAAFRGAAAGRDLDALEEQAHKAEAAGALTGWSPERVRQELGAPDRVAVKRRAFVWNVGVVEDDFGFRDERGTFEVEFDDRWGRVLSANVG